VTLQGKIIESADFYYCIKLNKTKSRWFSALIFGVVKMIKNHLVNFGVGIATGLIGESGYSVDTRFLYTPICLTTLASAGYSALYPDPHHMVRDIMWEASKSTLIGIGTVGLGYAIGSGIYRAFVHG